MDNDDGMNSLGDVNLVLIREEVGGLRRVASGVGAGTRRRQGGRADGRPTPDLNLADRISRAQRPDRHGAVHAELRIRPRFDRYLWSEET